MRRYDTTEGVLAAEKISNSVVEALQPFTESKHVEVQERAVLARSVLLQCTLCRRTAKEERKRMLLKEKEREEGEEKGKRRGGGRVRGKKGGLLLTPGEQDGQGAACTLRVPPISSPPGYQGQIQVNFGIFSS